MTLTTYKEKRHFEKTLEPKGKKIASGRGPLRFVVHKHQASHLHWDLRLELDGVLKSWAVPKGPSMNPVDKRLAQHVEDHPLEYASFHGTIPEGEYGAGTVEIWDEGVYAPMGAEVERAEAEKILRKQLSAGHLSIVFLGKKLKGEFALVKTHFSEKSWLLIKANDEYAKK